MPKDIRRHVYLPRIWDDLVKARMDAMGAIRCRVCRDHNGPIRSRNGLLRWCGGRGGCGATHQVAIGSGEG